MLGLDSRRLFLYWQDVGFPAVRGAVSGVSTVRTATQICVSILLYMLIHSYLDMGVYCARFVEATV